MDRLLWMNKVGSKCKPKSPYRRESEEGLTTEEKIRSGQIRKGDLKMLICWP